jgi:hypothetical protein
MDPVFILLFVLLGTGAIVYAGMRRPRRKSEAAAAGDGGATIVAPTRHDGDVGDSGGGDGAVAATSGPRPWDQESRDNAAF